MMPRRNAIGQAAAVADMNALASRILDITLAAAALVVLALPMLVITCAVWLEGGRPILFSQMRLGKGGQPFRMYKFRKFRAACGTDGCPLTMAGDGRMTPVGHVLAATKLDELPQLWNVLTGDMAIIGPRPESLAFADCFENGFEQVLEHKPGLLGPSQVLFRNEGELYPPDMDPTRFYRDVLFPTKARLDLAYFRDHSVLGDIVWLMRGVLAVLGWVPRPTAASRAAGWPAASWPAPADSREAAESERATQ